MARYRDRLVISISMANGIRLPLSRDATARARFDEARSKITRNSGPNGKRTGSGRLTPSIERFGPPAR